MGHGLQHHLIEGLGDEWGGQLPKIILEDACGHRAHSGQGTQLPRLEGSAGAESGEEEDRCRKVKIRPDRRGEVPEGLWGLP